MARPPPIGADRAPASPLPLLFAGLALALALTGCGGSSSPAPAGPPAAPLVVAPAWVTAGQAGFAASVSPRDGVTYAWTATNGTITSGAATPAVTFTPGASGAVTLTCTLTSGGGSAAGSATAVIVPAPTTPTVVAPAYVTQGESGYAASVAAQPGVTWAWTIAGGTINSGAQTDTIHFTAAAGATVELGCTATNAAGTAARGTGTAQVVAPPTLPVITAPATVTADQAGYAASVPVQPGAHYAWTILGGTITGGAGTSAITFTPDPTGTVILGCTVINAAGTSSLPVTATAAIVPAPRTPAVSAPAYVTAGTPGFTASVPAQAGSSYAWTIAGGTITAGAAAETVTFTPGASGLVTLGCTVTNSAGTASAPGSASSAILPVPGAPLVSAPAFVTAGQAGYVASVPAQAGLTHAWTISGGTITGGADGDAVTFTAGAGGGVTLSCTATNAAGTTSPPGGASSTVVAAPVITSFLAAQVAAGPFTASTHVRAGQTAWLLAQFANGTASADGGVGSVTTLTPVQTGALTAPTTFRLTVTNPAGTSATALTTVALSSLWLHAGAINGVGDLDGTGVAARFNGPAGAAAVAASGAVYVADRVNHLVRRVSPAGVVTTVAGAPGLAGYADGVGPAARFRFPQGVAVDSGETAVYVADTGNSLIRKIELASRTVTTLAGNVYTCCGSYAWPYSGFQDGTGVGYGTTFPGFNQPTGVAIGAGGTRLYVADSQNYAIREISLPGAVVTTLAGWTSGVAAPGPYPMYSYLARGYVDGPAIGAAKFTYPVGVAVDPAGVVYVADQYNNAIRFVNNGIVGTLAGTQTSGYGIPGHDDGPATTVATFRYPAGVAATADAVYVADTFNQTVRAITGSVIWLGGLAVPGTVSTLAGNALAGAGFADGAGAAARFSNPQGLASDGTALYLADTGNQSIRKVVPSTGATTTLAGVGVGPGATDVPPRFSNPTAMAIDSAGTLYVADTGNNLIRAVAADGTARVLAGQPGAGFRDGAGTAAQFSSPYGVAIDPTQRFLYVADYANHAVRKIDIASTLVTTVAGATGAAFPGPYAASQGYQDSTAYGDGTSARLYVPSAVAVDGGGNVFVTDTGNCAIRKIDTAGTVSTLAGATGGATFPGPYTASCGGADGTGPLATFSSPQGLASDSSGNLYVGDTGNNRIRVIQPGGVVTTIAGSGAVGGSDGTGSAATFSSPVGIAVGLGGRIYVADYSNGLVRLVTPVFTGGVPQPAAVTTVVGTPLRPSGGSVPGPLPASLYLPRGLAFDASSGTLYVSVPDAILAATVQ